MTAAPKLLESKLTKHKSTPDLRAKALKMDAAIDKLAQALKRASDTNGRPNTYSPKELHVVYGGPLPVVQGKIGKSHIYMIELWRRLGSRGGWGSCPRYAPNKLGKSWRWAV